jgi:predicted TIM-barrel fold metal-dependent hydrolase
MSPVTTGVDSHQHFWKYGPREYGWIDERMGVLQRDLLPADLEPSGSGRLMIGSDWRVCALAGDYGRTMAVVTDYLQGRSVAEREAVLGGNARDFWNPRGQGAPTRRSISGSSPALPLRGDWRGTVTDGGR